MKIKSIGIVGGGTAGFVTALILKSRYPDMRIDVICSSKIGIVGVGEGSTEHWNEFLKYVGISWRSVITQCDATFKAGIMFKGWSDQDYLHSTNPDFEPKTGQYHYVYGKQISEGFTEKTLTPNLVWNNQIDNRYLEDKDPPFNQFHFNTQKLNTFLHEIAKLKDIPVIDDEIIDVKLTDDEEISSIVGTLKEYSYDFYIDSTGFKKLLISKLGGKWISHSKYLKMNSAIVFPTAEKEEINLYTTAQAMDYGWMFNIPVWGRNGNGYIFDSNYIDATAAKQEVEKFLGHTIEVGKHITFDPGAVDRAWIKNCVAVGLSGNFIEPLEATSIGTSIQQAFLLMHRLPNYDEKTINQYNKAVNDIMENIRDFVILHYQTKKDNSQFWKDLQKLEIPESLATKLEKWRKNLPIEEDFSGYSKYILFREANFTQVLHGLNLFDQEKIAAEYAAQRKEIKDLAAQKLIDIDLYEKSLTTIEHKRFVELVRAGL
jgi:flavin-dependent dehydrogenase